MRSPSLLAFLVLTGSLGFACAAPSPSALHRGTVWFETGFENTETLQGWSGTARIEPGNNNVGAAALRSPATNQAPIIRRILPIEPVRGCTIRCSADIRAEDVSAKPNSWNGVKFMLIIEGPRGTQYPQASLGVGSFPWQRASFLVRIPSDATKATLVLGLELVSGHASFDNVKLSVFKTPVVKPPPVAGPMYKGHHLERLRGTMISGNIDSNSLALLGGKWNANLIRWQLTRPGRPGSGAEPGYDDWLEGELKKVEKALPICEKLGVFVVLDLHSPPGGKPTQGGYVGSDAGLFTDPQVQEKLVRLWMDMARRFKSARPIWGYDLVNEPVDDEVGEGCDDWQGLAERTARAIRSVDPVRTIIVEPAHWGGPDALDDFVPLTVSNVVYSVHMYLPHAFTHQNVFQRGPEWDYPGEIKGEFWDAGRLEKALQPAVDFQKRYTVHIYVGEFSAIRWAPNNSAYRYLRDAINIFEKHGWDWTYHAFREWPGWSVEHGSDPKDVKPAAIPTDREKLLREWFAQNQKPRW